MFELETGRVIYTSEHQTHGGDNTSTVHVTIPTDETGPIHMDVESPKKERVLMTIFNIPPGYDIRVYTLENCKMVELVKI